MWPLWNFNGELWILKYQSSLTGWDSILSLPNYLLSFCKLQLLFSTELLMVSPTHAQCRHQPRITEKFICRFVSPHSVAFHFQVFSSHFLVLLTVLNFLHSHFNSFTVIWNSGGGPGSRNWFGLTWGTWSALMIPLKTVSRK